MTFLRTSRDGALDVGRIPVRSALWTTPERGLRVQGDVDLTHRLRAEAVAEVSARTAAACDLTAAHLWSLTVPSGFGLEIDAQACAIATRRGGNRHRSAGVRGRRLTLPQEHLTVLDGTLITTPARTWLDCAEMTSFQDTVAMGDAILRAKLCSTQDLEDMVRWGRGRRGIRTARAALPILDAGSESPAESWVRAALVKGGVPRPVCNFTVIVNGREFRLDLAWPEQKVAVEYDGAEHHGPDRRHHDERRRALLRAAGWRIIVLRKEDLGDAPRVIKAVLNALAD